MNTFLKFPILLAIAWFLVKMVLFFSGVLDSLVIGIMVNILFLISSIALGLFFKKKAENYVEVNFLDDMKTAIKSGMLYVGLLAGFIYVFYGFVNTEYLHEFKEKQVAEMQSELEDEEYLKQVKAENENLKDLSKEDILDLQAENLDRFVSPGFMSTVSILSMMVGCFSFSILIVVLYRRVLFKDMEVKIQD